MVVVEVGVAKKEAEVKVAVVVEEVAVTVAVEVAAVLGMVQRVEVRLPFDLRESVHEFFSAAMFFYPFYCWTRVP